MKQLIKTEKIKAFLAFLILILTQTVVLAQDTMQSSTTTTKTSHQETQTWYTQPWVWIVAAAVLILLIVALTRGSSAGRTDKVTVTKTTSDT